MAAAAAVADNPVPPVDAPEIPQQDPEPQIPSTTSLLKEYEKLKSEVSAAEAAYAAAKVSGTQDDITQTSKALKEKRGLKRWTYNQAISRAVWPEV